MTSCCEMDQIALRRLTYSIVYHTLFLFSHVSLSIHMSNTGTRCHIAETLNLMSRSLLELLNYNNILSFTLCFLNLHVLTSKYVSLLRLVYFQQLTYTILFGNTLRRISLVPSLGYITRNNTCYKNKCHTNGPYD